MFRKLFMIGAAVAMPLGAVAVTTAVSSVASTGVAGATPLAITCKFPATTVTFAPPGLSHDGTFTTSSLKTKTKTSAGTMTCNGVMNGVIASQKIKSAPTACLGLNNPTAACTGASGYEYDSAAGYSTTATTIFSEIPTIAFTIGGTPYSITNTSSNAVLPVSGGKCGASESGFKIVGHLTLPSAHNGEATQLIACLSTDANGAGGANTTGNFLADIQTIIAGPSPIVIGTAQLDTALSKIKIS